MFSVYNNNECSVRSYCRKFPTEFKYAKNAILVDSQNQNFIDFFAGAGAMNYGHNNSYIKNAIMNYLDRDYIIHALDMYTFAKKEFLQCFSDDILQPRRLDYLVMCCGSTGTNAVEAALKLARKNKKRTNIFAFSGAFHGMSLGSLAMTSDEFSRLGSGVPLNNVTFMPYYTAFENPMMSLDYMENVLSDDHSGIDKPAAIVLETVQAEGGINPAPIEWLQRLRNICDKYDILMVVDDIQVGVGRCGTFFSFERAGIVPDMVMLSKSISGFGIPMSILLLKRELDIFKPGEHNGTFRGNQLAFVGAKAGIEFYKREKIEDMVIKKAELIKKFLQNQIQIIDERLEIRGIGMIWGIDFGKIDYRLAKEISYKCFEKGLIIELAGRKDAVLKILPPLTIEEEELIKGLEIIKEVIETVIRGIMGNN